MITVNDFIDSLIEGHPADATPSAPDGVMDLSDIIWPLRKITIKGRALVSSEPGSIGRMIGTLLRTFIPVEHTETDLEECVMGLSVLIGIILRMVPAFYPDMMIEEFLLHAASQEGLLALEEEFASTPFNTDPSGHTRPDVAQHLVFAMPTPITQEAIEGFIERNATHTYLRDLWDDYFVIDDTIIVHIDGDDDKHFVDYVDPYTGFEEYTDIDFDDE